MLNFNARNLQFVRFMLGVCPIVPNTNFNIDGYNIISTTVWNTQEKRVLSRCSMQTSISDNREKTDDSSAFFDVQPDLF